MSNLPIRYVSVDVECDGPDYGVHSCRMLGLAVSRPYPNLPGILNPARSGSWCEHKLRYCLEKTPGTRTDPQTMEQFWSVNQELAAYIQAHARPASEVARQVQGFLSSLTTESRLVFVAKPTSYDLPWLRQILIDGAVETDLIPHSSVCISSLLKGLDFLGINRKEVNATVRAEELPHTHFADDDALGQLYMFLQLRRLYREVGRSLGAR